MKRIFYMVSGFTVCLVMTGCSNYAIPRYASSADNLAVLRKIESPAVALGAFKTSDPDIKDTVMCRAAGPVKTPDGETFADYIRKALAAELTVADKYDERSQVVITGTLTTIQFNSQIGEWNLGLTLKSSNGQQLTADEKYSYGFSWLADTACIQTAQAAMGAIQDLIHKAVKDPAFASLMRPSRN